ncbi:MAG: type II secretion system protein [Elusimicrobiota bacterium]
MKKSRGFTLIELMVVIVILGILAAVIAPRIPQFVNKAKEGRTKGNLGTLRSTLNIYYSDNDGIYPVDTLTATLVPKYIKKIPDVVCPGSHLNPIATVRADTTAGVLAPSDTSGWNYENTSTEDNWGDICVNCSLHKDNTNAATGSAWSSF